jgi:hypothetical protein
MYVIAPLGPPHMSEHEKIPVAAEKSTLTLKTIAACLIIIIPILVSSRIKRTPTPSCPP